MTSKLSKKPVQISQDLIRRMDAETVDFQRELFAVNGWKFAGLETGTCTRQALEDSLGQVSVGSFIMGMVAQIACNCDDAIREDYLAKGHKEVLLADSYKLPGAREIYVKG